MSAGCGIGIVIGSESEVWRCRRRLSIRCDNQALSRGSGTEKDIVRRVKSDDKSVPQSVGGQEETRVPGL